MRKTLLGLLGTIGLLLGLAAPASAYDPVNVVHTEQVQAGPYKMTIGFSTWPLKAMQSLDFTFTPDDGIASKAGMLTMSLGDYVMDEPLARHPRKREVWGLDIRSLPEPGEWTLRFDVEGPAGVGTGELKNLQVMQQPGPPMGLSWAVSTIPLFGLIALIVVAWRRTRVKV
ncbi:hypothetical protein JOF56_011440 [Kibdelosporangium banguiense]|uniref:YtkA-like domain-containing protein n=1 Tax=Kibdelosporangium banguiense TaxID=1365924 RepID=A0ABS4U4D3_9PSEU|nr:hypothetical protein [Kibdelosporangium banguiense]MBP2331055.1 hypothetical protein [Kibdelosporangium banguiense]